MAHGGGRRRIIDILMEKRKIILLPSNSSNTWISFISETTWCEIYICLYHWWAWIAMWPLHDAKNWVGPVIFWFNILEVSFFIWSFSDELSLDREKKTATLSNREATFLRQYVLICWNWRLLSKFVYRMFVIKCNSIKV